MSNVQRITLYSAVESPFPHRVHLALEEAKAEYDLITIDLIDKPEWYEKKVNHQGGKVPYLVYGGPKLNPDESPDPSLVQFPESLVILEFLADIFPHAHLLPTDPALRAKARLFYGLVETRFLPAFAGNIFRGTVPQAELLGALEALQAQLPPAGGFAVGEWSIADAALLPLLMRMQTALAQNPQTMPPGEPAQTREILQSPRFARLQRYIADNAARPSMAKTWDEAAVVKKFEVRMERLKKTGVKYGETKPPVSAEAK